MAQQKALAPDTPFFIYFAPGATHAPHHVPKEWADRYKGKFDTPAAYGVARCSREMPWGKIGPGTAWLPSALMNAAVGACIGRHQWLSSFSRSTAPPATAAAPSTTRPIISSQLRGAEPVAAISSVGRTGSLLAMRNWVLELPPHELGA